MSIDSRREPIDGVEALAWLVNTLLIVRYFMDRLAFGPILIDGLGVRGF
jgi:hypothetical protein